MNVTNSVERKKASIFLDDFTKHQELSLDAYMYGIIDEKEQQYLSELLDKKIDVIYCAILEYDKKILKELKNITK